MKETTASRTQHRARKPQQARGRAKYEHVLDVTESLLVDEGYDAINTNAIAAAAGISIGSLYHYFPDKAAVLTALAERFYERYMVLMAAYHESLNSSVPIRDYVEGLLGTLETFAEQNPALGPSFVVASLAVTEIDDLDRDYHRKIIEMLADHYRKVKPALGSEAASAAATTVMLVLDALFLEGDDATDVLADEAIRMLTAYLEMYL